MPPSNVSFATALDLGTTLPINNTQSDINDAGVNYTVFYKFTCPAGLRMVWAWATSDQVAGYMPKMVPYDQSEVEILQESIIAPLGNNPIQFPVTPGQVHYLQVVKNADSAGPEHVDLQIRTVPNDTTIPDSAIIINGDIPDQPCGVFSPNTNYQTIKFIKGIAIGEGGCISSDGKILLENRIITDKYIALYSGDELTELGRDSTMLAFSWIRYNRTTGKFWIMVLENAGFAKLYRLDPSVLPLAKTLIATITGAGNGGGISTNNAETIAYYQEGGANGKPIHRWNLSTDSAMTDLAAAPGAAYYFLDSMVLEDDTILVGWSSNDGPTGLVKVRRYQPDGTQINEYQFDSFELGSYGLVRLAYATDSPTSFWVKLRERSGATATGDAIFNRIRVSDGQVLNTVRHLEYNERNYIGPASVSYRGESGIWNSCPLVVFAGLPTPPLHGLLFGNPTIRHDIYPDQAKKIPNPTVRTAYIGD